MGWGLALLVVAGALSPRVALADEWFPYLGLRLTPSWGVSQVHPGSPADRAGVQVGDRLVSVDGAAVTIKGLRGAPGSHAHLEFERGGGPVVVDIVRAALPPAAGPASVAAGTAAGTGTVELDEQDRQLLRFESTGAGTDVAVQLIARGLSRLPAAVKQRFVDAGVTIRLVAQESGTPDHPDGAHYEPGPRVIRLCVRTLASRDAVEPRLPITVLHELGHAFDQLLGYPSRGAAFLAVYREEAARVPAAHRATLAHFLRPGQSGPGECFASLFVCRYYAAADRRLDALRADFPRSRALADQWQ